MDVAADDFWRTRWVYTRIQHQIAFIYNGQVNFIVRSLNQDPSSIRLLCAFEGKYLVEETTQVLVDSSDTSNGHDGVQCLSCSCFIPNATGRGFIEVNDHGLGNTFYTFIVAEEDVSSEIRMLECIINGVSSDGNCHGMVTGMKHKTQALDFNGMASL